MQPFLTARREEIAALCRKHHVRRLAVFGSAARDDFDPERSDVDVLVEFDPAAFGDYVQHYFDLRDGLETLFQRPVDLLREGVVRNEFRLQSMNQDRRELYAA